MPTAAKIAVLKEFIVVCSKGTLKSFSLRDGSTAFSYQHKFDSSIVDGNNKPLDEKLEDMTLSDNQQYICVLYSDKKMIIVNSDTWSIARIVITKRRSTAVTFQHDNETVLVADKSGDVYRYSVHPDHTNGNHISVSCTDGLDTISPILGHVSMLLDIRADKNYIFTADRDEKIRVSDLHRPYIIQSFCLGHTEFVCKILPLGMVDNSLVLSCSGDSKVKLWDAALGSEITSLDILSQIQQKYGEECEVKFVPSILSCNGERFLISSDQPEYPYVFVFDLNLALRDFTLRSQLKLKDCHRVCDVKFTASANNFYVLSVSNPSLCLSLALYSYAPSSGECSRIEDDATLACTNLNNFVVERSDSWASLFKVRSDGETYGSYYKRKAERLSTKAEKDAKRTKAAL